MKRSKKNRLAALLLAIVLVVQGLPLAAFADNASSNTAIASAESSLMESDPEIESESQAESESEPPEESKPEESESVIESNTQETESPKESKPPAESKPSEESKSEEIKSPDKSEIPEPDESKDEESDDAEAHGIELFAGLARGNEVINVSSSGFNDQIVYLSNGNVEYGWNAKTVQTTGRTAYCVQQGVALNAGNNGGYGVSTVDSDLYRRMSLADYFGRVKRSGSALKNEFLTQLYIWELQGIAPTSMTSYGSWAPDVSMAEYTAYKNEVVPKINSFFVKPSFNGQTVTLQPGQSITLTDTNGSFQYYENSPWENTSNVTLSKSGNKLTITAKSTSTTNSVKYMFDVDAGFRYPILYYDNPQTQDCIVNGLSDPTSFTINVRINKLGDLKIVKTSEDGVVAGVKFRVVGGGYDWTATTNAKGEISSPGWPVSDANGKEYKYVVTELNVPGRYNTPASQTITFSPGKTTTVKFNNTLKKGNVKLVKTSDDGILAGLKFEISGNGKTQTATTDANGAINIKNLQVFDANNKQITYTAKELSTPGRYTQPASQTFKLDAGKTATVKFSNILKKGNVKLIKTSEDGILSGLKFEITGGGSTYTKTTDAKGEISVKDMRVYDANNKQITYTAKEISTPGRYVQPAIQTFKLETGKTTTIKFSNILKKGNVKLVKTSEDGILSGLKFEITGGGSTYTKTTDANGEISVKDMRVYDKTNEKIVYSVEEISTPERYVQPEKQEITLTYGEITTVNFENVLKRADLKLIKTSEDRIVEGLEFRLTGDGVDVVVKTDENGEITVPDLRVYDENNEKIIYSVEEINTPARYIQPKKQEITLTYGEITTVNFSNVLQRAELKIIKQSEDGIIEGLEFRITGGDVDLVKKTDKNGKITVRYLRVYDENNEKIVYFVEEINTPERYVQPEKQEITLLTGLEDTVEPEENNSEESKPAESGTEESDQDNGTSLLPSETKKLFAGLSRWLRPMSLSVGGRTGGQTPGEDTANLNSDLQETSKPEESGLEEGSGSEDPEDLNLTEFYNSMIRGTVEVIKTDAENPESKLSGAVFTVFSDTDDDGDYKEGVDEQYGMLQEDEGTGLYTLSGLTHGRYFLKETTPPEGFLPDTIYYPFEITEDGQVVRMESVPGKDFPNQPIKGTIQTTKVNAENPTEKLSGGVFDVYVDVNQDGKYTEGVDTLAGTLQEVERGVYRLSDLRHGDYLFHERTAPKGFVADRNYYPFKITEDGQLVKFESIPGKDFPNYPVSTLPQTGDQSNIILPMILAGCSAVVLISCLIINRKRGKKTKS